jgi:thioesterase domain-containing protein/acyl carrier protein
VVAEARAYRGDAPEPLDVKGIALRCAARDWISPDGFLAQSFMRFGPRWANLRRVRYGQSEALIELRLDDRFAGDLGSWGLHPAVMDMATGGAQTLIPGVDLAKDFYVPISYGRVRVFATMPQAVVSHVHCLPGSGERLAYFDVILAGEDGQVFAEVSRFTMKRVEPNSVAISAARSNAGKARHEMMDAVLREAIDAPAGLEAFDRIMAQPNIVQAMASSVDLALWNRQLNEPASGQADDAQTEGFQRPELAADYAAPTTAAEKTLAAIWSELLGVRQVGVDDDFFDLGGNSLVGVRLFAAIKKQLGVALPLATLFEAPTIAELAALLPAEGVEPVAGEASAWSPLVRINIGAEGRTPVFCVHGSRGNVMIFKSLADRLGATRPFFALQARGVDGELEPDETIEAMAERYLAAIREVQPAGPYILAGYSGGGVIAYEMAQRLTAAGDIVEIVAMIDTLEPNEMRRPIGMLDRLRNMHRVKPWRFLALPSVLLRYHLAPWVSRKLGVARAPAPLTSLEAAAVAVDAAYHRAQWAYQPLPYPGDILLVRAKDARMHFLRSGATLGWRNFVRGTIHQVDVDADHFTVFDDPAVSQMTTAIKAVLRGETSFTAQTGFAHVRGATPPGASPMPFTSTTGTWA